MAEVDTSSYPKPQARNSLQDMATAIGAANGIVDNRTKQFDLAKKQLDFMRSSLSGLLANPNVTREDVATEAIKMIGQGVATPQQVAKEMAGMPSDPQGIRQRLGVHLAQTLDGQQKLESMMGGGAVNNGNGTQATQRNLFTGQVNRMGGNAGYIPHEMGPEQRSQPTTVMQNGVPVQVPMGNVQPPTGPTMAPQVRRAPMGSPPNALVQQPAPVEQNALQAPAAPTQPIYAGQQPKIAMKGQPASPASAGGLPAGISTTVPAGAVQAAVSGATNVSDASAKQFAEDTTHSAQLQTRLYGMKQAITSLDALGKTGTGPGTDTVNRIKSFLQSAGVPGIDMEKIKNYDEAKKYLTDYVNKSGNVSSDARLLSAISGNASTNISNAAASDVAKMAVAGDRMRAAKAAAFAKTGLPPGAYSQWAAEWDKEQDPRGFAIDLMGPEKFKALRENLKKTDTGAYSRFANSVAAAHNAKVLFMPEGQ